MKFEGFVSTGSYIATEYLKVDPVFLNAIIEKLLRVDEDAYGEFLLIGNNYFMTPKGLKILASNMAVPGNAFRGVDRADIEKLWADLYIMEVIDLRLYYLMKTTKRSLQD